MKTTLVVTVKLSDLPKDACPVKSQAKMEKEISKILLNEGFDEAEFDGETIRLTVFVSNFDENGKPRAVSDDIRKED